MEGLEDRTLLSSTGVNVKGITPWAGEPTTVDVRPILQPWGQLNGDTYSSDPTLKLTAQGYPLSNAGTFTSMGGYPNGTYQVSYSGTATLSFAVIASMG